MAYARHLKCRDLTVMRVRVPPRPPILMNLVTALTQNPTLLLAVSVWEAVWKGLALWKSAGKKQKYWFIALLVINSVGILPIIYLLIDKYHKPKSQ